MPDSAELATYQDLDNLHAKPGAIGTTLSRSESAYG